VITSLVLTVGGRSIRLALDGGGDLVVELEGAAERLGQVDLAGLVELVDQALREPTGNAARCRRYRLRQSGGLPPADRSGTVYFATDERGRVKIGVSKNPWARAADLARSEGGIVQIAATMPGGYAGEAEQHERWSAYRETGEWFRLEGDLLVFVEELAATRRVVARRHAVVNSVATDTTTRHAVATDPPPPSPAPLASPPPITPSTPLPPVLTHPTAEPKVAASRKARSPRPLAAELGATAKRLWDYHEGLRVKHGLATRARGFDAQGREVGIIARLVEHVAKREACSRDEAIEHIRRWRFRCVIQARDASRSGDERAKKLREWCAGETAWRPTSYDATDGGATFDHDPNPDSSHYPER
jgi:hypothetical protein